MASPETGSGLTQEEQERADTLCRENPAAWVLLMLTYRFPQRNIARDVAMMELVGDALSEVERQRDALSAALADQMREVVDLRERLAVAVNAETEACAEIAERFIPQPYGGNADQGTTARVIARAIRARATDERSEEASS